MEFEYYQQKFSEKALSSGYSAENLLKCLSYAKKLIDADFPVIYNLEHFSALVGYNTSYISRAIDHSAFFYRNFEVKKSNGGVRKISEPLPSLKEIQYWILNEILYKVEISKFAKAYVPNSSLKQNIIFHKDQPIVLTLDIQDFFGSLKRADVSEIFKNLGYSAMLSNAISKVCCLNDVLPQGAPTSPCISNILMKEFDDAIAGFCLPQKIRYTRYADDLTFSGSFNKDVIIKKVEELLKPLKLNRTKTKLMVEGNRQIVTGVVVNQKLQVSKEKRLKIRQQMYYIKKYGLIDHLRKTRNTKENYLRHILGQINFILYINKDDTEFIQYKEFLNGLKNNNN